MSPKSYSTTEESKKKIISHLPKVKGIIVRPPSREGQWEKFDHLLAGLPKDLDIDINIHGSASIPSIWGRALIFDEALTDDRHPEHEIVKNEWRGLMGIFCFRDCFGLRLNITNLSLDSQNDRLTTTISIQKPDEWPNLIYLLKIDGLLIGGSSPKTLFFTPPEYECSKFIPWYENGKLYDPLKYFDAIGFDKEKKILKRWIEVVTDAYLQGHVSGGVIQPFNEWLGAMKDIQSDPTIAFQSHPTGIARPYDFVNTYFSWQNSENSDFFLRGSRNVQKPPIMVWERDGWDRGGRVFNSWHYVNFGKSNQVPEEPLGQNLCAERIQYPWIRPERFFLTDQILRLPTIDENQIAVYGEETDNIFRGAYLAPLKQEILDYLSPEDLKGKLNMQEAEGGGIKVTLALPLGNGRFLNIFKTYNQDQIINILEPDVRPFAVWPDFVRTGWNRYYCIYGEIRGLELKPWFYDAPPNSITAHEIELEIPNRLSESHFIWEIPKFPEAVVCSYNGEQAGIILLSSPREVKPLGIEWDVVIDLGTVNTAVFYRQGARDPNPMEFKNHCFNVLKTAEVTTSLFLNTLFFSPETYSVGIFSTGFIKPTRRIGVLTPVVDGKASLGSWREWLFWVERDPFLFRLLRDDLKWSRDEDEKSCLYAYLKYLILLICGEAGDRGVNRINLKWSYPSAFSEEMRLSLGAAFVSLPNSVGDIRNAINVTIGEEDREGETESIAVCRYLSKEKESIEPRGIIDIGGGTSDIGIWDVDEKQTQRLIFQTSILFAGKVFIDYLQKRDDLRRNILLSLNLGTEGPFFDYFTSKCAHCFNILAMYNHDNLYPLFTVNKSTDKDLGYMQARSIIFLMFAGTIYYVGLILKHTKTRLSGIWLAGNGSKMINLVHPQAVPYLKRFLSSEELIDISPADARHTKQEVARGVLSDVRFRTLVLPRVIIGEDGYSFGGNQVGFDQEITLQTLIADKIEAPEDFPQLSKFLELYNKCANVLQLVPLEMTRGLRVKIRETVKGRIAYLKSMADSHKGTDTPYQGLIQPPFVEELKTLIQETLHKKE